MHYVRELRPLERNAPSKKDSECRRWYDVVGKLMRCKKRSAKRGDLAHRTRGTLLQTRNNHLGNLMAMVGGRLRLLNYGNVEGPIPAHFKADGW